jgi:hypothetical protein
MKFTPLKKNNFNIGIKIMYTINIVLEALSLYNNNLSFRKTSKIL